MKKAKGVVSVFLSICLFISIFAGCSKKVENANKTDPTGTNTSESVKTNDLTPKLPIVDKKITLKYWVPITAMAAQIIRDMNENDAYIEMEKRTNIHIEFLHPAANQVPEQFNLMMAAGDLPDLIGNATRYKGGGELGVEEKVYLKLNDLIEKYAPNYQALRKSNPEIAKQTINDSGLLWAFYQIVPYEEVIATGPVLKKEWLTELNIPEPVTIDDWYKMLKAFKEKKNCDAPLLIGEKGYNNGGVFTSAFDTGEAFINKNGKVTYGFIEPGFKDFLTLMNKWYKEGLIDKDFPTRKGTAREQLICTDKAGAIILSPDTVYTSFKPLGLTVLAPDFPVQTPGQKLHYRTKFDYSFTPDGNAVTAISAACKNPIEAVKWLDYGYSQEGHMLFNYGIEGKTYNMVNGKPVYTDLMMKNPEGISMNLLIWKLRLHDGPFMRLATRSNPVVLSYEDSLKIRGKWTTNVGSEYVLPPITLNAEEGEKSTRIMTDIDAYKDEMILKFIIGSEPLAKFDEYVANIKKLGIEEAVKMRENSLARYNKR